jgi:hypothetical protein
VKPWSLLDRRCYRSGRRGRFGDRGVDLFPNDCIGGVFGDDGVKKGLNVVEVVIVRTDRRGKSQQVGAEMVVAATGRKQT